MNTSIYVRNRHIGSFLTKGGHNLNLALRVSKTKYLPLVPRGISYLLSRLLVLGWISIAADSWARIRGKVVYLRGDPKKHWYEKREVIREGQGIRWDYDNEISFGKVKLSLIGNFWVMVQNIPQSWGLLQEIIDPFLFQLLFQQLWKAPKQRDCRCWGEKATGICGNYEYQGVIGRTPIASTALLNWKEETLGLLVTIWIYVSNELTWG